MKLKSVKKILFFTFTVFVFMTGFLTFSKNVAVLNQSTFVFSGNKIAGIDITGLDRIQAQEKLKQAFTQMQKDLEITLTYEDKKIIILGKDLVPANFEYLVHKAIEDNKPKTFIEKINIFRPKNKIIVPRDKLISSFDNKILSVCKQIERKPAEPKINFYPNRKEMFEVSQEQIGVVVNVDKLKADIISALQESDKIQLEIPVFLTPPKQTKKQVLSNLKLRSKFSTSYANSVGGRKHNILLAMRAFNGLRVESGEIVSFNNIINKNVKDSEIKTAKIIVNGQFIDGKGGGLCQASTTVYNAVLLADLEILEVHPHSLPVGYVSMAFDAMVNFGSADMVFRNNTDHPIFIKAWGDENDCYVEIYGEPLPKGLEIKRKSKFIRSIPHSGDKIIPDTKGIYIDKIIFKGEYYRVKYPQEGYEAEGYLQYYVDGELVEEKLVRRARYNSQQGIIYEGTEELFEGLTLPENKVKHIAPQRESLVNNQTVEEKIKQVSPPHYSP